MLLAHLYFWISTIHFLSNSLPLLSMTSTVDSGCTFWRKKKKKKSMTWNFGILQKEKLEGKRMGIYCSEWSVTVKFSDIHWSAEHWKCNIGASTKAMSFSFDLDQIKMNWKSPTKWFFSAFNSKSSSWNHYRQLQLHISRNQKSESTFFYC